MFQSVTIESDALRMDVWPQLGGKVSSLLDKADHYELLFSYPAEIPDRGPQYDRPYADSWCVGWDECFPSVAPSKYAGYPYDGIASPDHGEIWGLPTTAVPTKNGITTVWHGLRFGYRLTRKLYLEDASIISEYTLVNLAPFVFRFVWAQHALLSMKSPIELAIKGADWRFSHDAQNQRVDRPFTWPKLGELDLSRPDSLPDARGWKVFSTAPIDAPAVINFPARRRRLTMEFASEDGVQTHWGIWMNTGGWNQYRHLSLEPTTGRFDELDRCIRDGSAGRIDSLGKLEWSTRWTVAPT